MYNKLVYNCYELISCDQWRILKMPQSVSVSWSPPPPPHSSWHASPFLPGDLIAVGALCDLIKGRDIRRHLSHTCICPANLFALKGIATGCSNRLLIQRTTKIMVPKEPSRVSKTVKPDNRMASQYLIYSKSYINNCTLSNRNGKLIFCD